MGHGYPKSREENWIGGNVISLHWNWRTVIQKQAQIVIQSDATLTGWGAVCDGVSTGGSWSPQEQTMHIYQLLGTPGYGIGNEDLLEGSSRSLSVTAAGQFHCSSVHQQSWGHCIISSDLSGEISVAVGLERDIALTAQHIPGVSNKVADSESRLQKDQTDWMLAHEVFQKINQIFGPLEVDLFAFRLTHQLPHFFSWRPDPLAEATDGFQQDWRRVRGYANSPWCLIGRVLNKIWAQEAQVVLVAPVWKGQAWYPVLTVLP